MPSTRAARTRRSKPTYDEGHVYDRSMQESSLCLHVPRSNVERSIRADAERTPSGTPILLPPIEISTSRNTSLHITTRKKTFGEVQVSRETNPRYSRKIRKARDTAIPYPKNESQDSKTLRCRASEQPVIDRGCLRETVEMEDEKLQASTVEFVQYLSSDNTKELSIAQARIDEYLHQLTEERKFMLAELSRVKDTVMELGLELGEVRRYLSCMPPRYRRRDDPRGKPFKDWRRDPSTKEHLPGRIDTELANQWAEELNRATVPIKLESGTPAFRCAEGSRYENGEVVRIFKDEYLPDPPVWDDDHTTVRAEEPRLGIKRVHEEDTDETDENVPPTKRQRLRETSKPVVMLGYDRWAASASTRRSERQRHLTIETREYQ
ncbi:uncharacterized protein FOMMEDRAFT_150867 [Fomitiporia mediterranea MF3/22]|uniref:uncharacterized protein n=1 Tax=Fomitiporia mediterranea (strain MF3/22) TaxID=694068 RepID=UPI0004408CB8|nr:uncharacterized protein FOMMEDRAFT_150867 [Fomitiporia mediterranea MF3/22]EJD08170.1 hypothetical protein FOMMEDRAFT_150867 [Fomitiporia mediterranea MF3/22]